ncbi:hypothetical protein [Vibrio harveyi]|uniref:hypothetical protein n=1 Tax=Vibrio harveyi TaxID=669 RepID=UPI0025AF49CD|nr:hypothetical protein [Vibrio harveyi]WJT09290.1 hypothetical protein PH545_25010 [Vibrio harveyi]
MSGGGGDNEVKETSYQKELARVASQEWNRNQDVFVPLQNQYIEYSHSMGEKPFYDKVADDTSLAFTSKYGEAQKQANKRLAAAGVDPTSGKAQAVNNELIQDKLGNENQATSQGQQDQTTAYTGNLANVAAMGRGQQTQAVNSLQDVANASGRRAEQNAINKANELSIPGAVAGVGASIAANNPDWFNNSSSYDNSAQNGGFGANSYNNLSLESAGNGNSVQNDGLGSNAYKKINLSLGG